MNKVLKSILSGVLVSALIFSTAGCRKTPSSNDSYSDEYEIIESEIAYTIGGSSNKENTTQSGNNNSGTQNNTSGGTTSGGTAATNEKRDLKGRTITFLANWEEPKKGNSDFDNRYWAKKTEVEKKYNCKFKHMFLSDGTVYDTFITSILSGDPIADVVCYPGNPYPAIQKKLFYDLSSLKEFNFSDDKWSKTVAEMGKINNKQYLMLSIKYQRYNLIYYNKDVFSRYKAEDLWTLQKNGKLTLNKLVEVATSLSKAMGKPSMIGYTTAKSVHDMFAASMNVVPIEKVSNKFEFKVNVNSSKMVEAYNKAQQLIKDGVLYDDTNNKSWTYGSEQFAAGKVPIIMNSEGVGDTDFNVGMCILPTADGKMCINSSRVHWCAIPCNTKNPSDVAAVWNEMTDVIFDVDYKIRYRDTATDDMMDCIEAYSNAQVAKAGLLDLSGMLGIDTGDTFKKMIAGSITPAEAVQSVEPIYTSAVATYK